MRAMLDQLMGTTRDGESSRYNVKFSDPKVCKSFLLGCCPHEILASTYHITPRVALLLINKKDQWLEFLSLVNKFTVGKTTQNGYSVRAIPTQVKKGGWRMDIGECVNIHDLALRADYEKASETKDYGYQVDAMDHLTTFVGECDRKTEAAKKRLAETQEELSAEVAAKAQKVHLLAEQIGQKLAKAEQLGAEGFVDESMKMMEEVEEFRKKKAAAEQEYRNAMPASSYQQQKLRVCEVCSAYLGIHDNDRRLADHFGGKLHLGFIKIREKLAELQVKVEERRRQRHIQPVAEDREKQRERQREREREDRERERERERERDRRRERRRSRDRSPERLRDRRNDGRNRPRSPVSRNHRQRSSSRDSGIHPENY
uniref:EOG090X0BOE n=1 Tax=Daphnia similis TaxID=35528 RepID=A0A4Y7LSK1_9CRUS|nr:EOG090X0BOE [Daphnia similis]SVE71259.1 EOG090X0BOE [Daphnia similis]SVE71891.1 EOG090X0BOE [Daphnia similis]SVE72517.1 EOG090X0BOE [Daphnia similis]